MTVIKLLSLPGFSAQLINFRSLVHNNNIKLKRKPNMNDDFEEKPKASIGNIKKLGY